MPLVTVVGTAASIVVKNYGDAQTHSRSHASLTRRDKQHPWMRGAARKVDAFCRETPEKPSRRSNANAIQRECFRTSGMDRTRDNIRGRQEGTSPEARKIAYFHSRSRGIQNEADDSSRRFLSILKDSRIKERGLRTPRSRSRIYGAPSYPAYTLYNATTGKEEKKNSGRSASHLSSTLSIFIAPFRRAGICHIRKPGPPGSPVGHRATTHPLIHPYSTLLHYIQKIQLLLPSLGINMYTGIHAQCCVTIRCEQSPAHAAVNVSDRGSKIAEVPALRKSGGLIRRACQNEGAVPRKNFRHISGSARANVFPHVSRH